MNLAIQIVGYLAATFAIVLYAPQSYKSWKTKDVSTLSVPTFLFAFFGGMLWLFYGTLDSEKIASAITSVGISILMFPIIHLMFFHKNKVIYWFMVAGVVLPIIFMIVCYSLKADIKPPKAVMTAMAVTCSSLTAWIWLPQVIKIFKSKDAHSISVVAMIISAIAQTFWVTLFALLIAKDPSAFDNYVFILNSAIPIVLSVLIVLMALMYKKKHHKTVTTTSK